MNLTTKTTNTIPPSVTRKGYLKLPEWMAYFLSPQSLIIVREISRTLKRNQKRPYSDITNLQLANRCGMSVQTVNRILVRLDQAAYIQRWPYQATDERKRRKIYFKNMRVKREQKLHGRSFLEVLNAKCFKDSKRIEWSRMATDDWLEWIPIPHDIGNSKDLKVYSVLVGQHMRGRTVIRLSDRQISAITNMDREVVADSIGHLANDGYIVVKSENRRSRNIEFL